MDFLVKNLKGGKRYAVQVRSISETDVSAWSPRVIVEAETDNSIPANVTGLSGTYSNQVFKFTWNSVTTNTSGLPMTDFSEYEITIGDGTNSYLATSKTPAINVDANDYTSKLGSGDTISCSVVARDSSGNVSVTPATTNVSAPSPSDVTNFTATAKVSGIDLSWTRVTNVTIDLYEIYVGDTSGFTPDTSGFTNLAGTTSGDKFSWSQGGTSPVQKYFKIRAKSIFGEYSNFVLDDTTTIEVDTAVSLEQTFTYSGVLATYVGDKRYYINNNATITGVRASVDTAPTGSSILVDVNKNGTTIFTTQANRPTIAASGFTSGLVTNMNVTSVSAGDYITIDIDQIGSTIAGSNLTVQLRISEA